MIKKIFAVIEKDIKQLFHSKSSALIILISPIVLIVLAGIALSTSGLTGIKVGIFAPEKDIIQSTLNEKIVSKGFEIAYFQSLEQCKQSVKQEITHICIEIADKGDENLARLDPRLTKKVNFYVDYSKVRLVWAIVNAIRSIVAQESNKITTEIATKVTNNIDATINVVENSKKEIDNIISKIETAKKEIRATDDYITNINEKLNKIREFVDSIDLAIKDISQSNSGIATQVDIYCKNVNNVALYIPAPHSNTLVSECSQLEDFIKSEIRQIDTNINAINENNRQIIKRIDAVKEGKSSATAALSEIEYLLDANTKKLEQLQKDIDKAIAEVKWAKDIKPNDIINPIPVEILPISGEVSNVGSVSSAITYIDYLLPALLILLIMFVSTLIASTIVIKERKSSAYFRNIISPSNSALFVIGVYLISTIMVILQSALLVTIGNLVFHVEINSPLTMAIIVFLTTSTFVSLGIIVGYLFNSEETTMMGAISLVLIFLLFSTLIIPIETMPLLMQAIAKFSPFVISETALRKNVIFGIPLSGCKWEIIKLSAIFIVFMITALFIESKRKKKEI